MLVNRGNCVQNRNYPMNRSEGGPGMAGQCRQAGAQGQRAYGTRQEGCASANLQGYQRNRGEDRGSTQSVQEASGCGCQEKWDNVQDRSDSVGYGCPDHGKQGYRQETWQNAAPDCGMAELASMSRSQLLTYIDEVSFAAYEALLYLDTHPNCDSGLAFFQENNQKRNAALKVYEHSFGPLTVQGISDSCKGSWEWVEQPWPWEGGNC